MATAEQERNLELVRESTEAFNRGEIDTVFSFLDPEIEVHTPPSLPNHGTFHGHAGYLKWVNGWLEAWEEFVLELRGFEPIGDHHVIVEVHQRGVGKGSGVETEMVVWWMVEIHGEKATRFHLYPDRESAIAGCQAPRVE